MSALVDHHANVLIDDKAKFKNWQTGDNSPKRAQLSAGFSSAESKSTCRVTLAAKYAPTEKCNGWKMYGRNLALAIAEKTGVRRADAFKIRKLAGLKRH
jgi:hypothetical protein